MKKTYTLTFDPFSQFYENRTLELCLSELQKFFDLSDKPEKIDIVLSSTPSKQAYFVKLIAPFLWPDIGLTLSNGVVLRINISHKTAKVLRKYPKGVWVSVRA